MIPVDVLERVQEGHDLASDPPSGLTSAMRWTCARCGDAVLRVGSNVYGSATKRTCAQSLAGEWGAA